MRAAEKGFAEDTMALLKDKGSEGMRARIARDRGFPRGPAAKSVVLNHMAGASYSAEDIAEAERILVELRIA